MRNTMAFAALIAAVVLAGCIGSSDGGTDYNPPPPPSLSISGLEQLTFYDVNQYRIQNGVSPLLWNDDLAVVARQYSENMAQNNFFAHRDLQGGYHDDRLHAAGIYYYSMSGENLLFITVYEEKETTNGVVTGVDYFTLEEFAAEAALGWMNSTGHRENMLRPQFDESGMGVAVAADGEKYYFTQLFIKRATCGYSGGPCCVTPGYYPSCYESLRCIDMVCT